MARGPSEQRRRKRKHEEQRFVTANRIAELRSQGASCASCRSFSKIPSQVLGPGKYCCALDTDFHGYAITTADDLCVGYSRKQEPQPTDGGK